MIVSLWVPLVVYNLPWTVGCKWNHIKYNFYVYLTYLIINSNNNKNNNNNNTCNNNHHLVKSIAPTRSSLASAHRTSTTISMYDCQLLRSRAWAVGSTGNRGVASRHFDYLALLACWAIINHVIIYPQALLRCWKSL